MRSESESERVSEESWVPEGVLTVPSKALCIKPSLAWGYQPKVTSFPREKSLDQIRTNYFFTFLLWKTALPLDLCWPSGDQVDLFVEPTRVKALRCQARLHYFCNVGNLCCSEKCCNIVANTTLVSVIVDAWSVAQSSGWCARRLLWSWDNWSCWELMGHSHLLLVGLLQEVPCTLPAPQVGVVCCQPSLRQ